MTDIDIEAVVQAYAEAALFTGMDESDDNGGEPLDQNYSVEDITEESLENMHKDVREFVRENRETIESALSNPHYPKLDESQLGHDYWMTRNGHGVGFWETPEDWPEVEGQALYEACKHTEAYLFVGDDGKLHYE